jgi:small subunit ribosomal protein S4
LSQFLEQRLDNVLFRLGFAPTRSSARQLIVHGHVKLNKGILNVPSHQVRAGDVIAFGKEASLKIPYVETSIANKDLIIPDWLEKKGPVGKLIAEPNADIVEKQINLRLVIEYYSR